MMFWKKKKDTQIAPPVSTDDMVVGELAIINANLKRQLTRSTDEMITIIMELINAHNQETFNRHDRIDTYLRKFIMALISIDNPYKKQIMSWDTDMYINAAQLHDIGKIGVTDNVLLKTDQLDDTDLKILREHVTIGIGMISRIRSKIGTSQFIDLVELLIQHHHERWDGMGYPNALSGEDIPLEARILAIIDTYDAMVTSRPYKDAIGHDQAMIDILSESGKQFDPDLVDVFINAF